MRETHMAEQKSDSAEAATNFSVVSNGIKPDKEYVSNGLVVPDIGQNFKWSTAKWKFRNHTYNISQPV